MTIKLNEYDKRLLSQITPASKWDKLKSIYAINSVIKQLKIGNKKIGLKCAKHLQKLSKQNTTSLQEIKEGCRDLKIPKQKIPLAKDKTKRPIESTHKINKATEKAPKGKATGGTGAAQPQADLIGGLFTAFKAQEAKQARDSQFNVLSSEMNRAAQNINRGVFNNRNIDLARVEQQARESAGMGRAFGSQDTALQQLKVNLLLEREAKQLGDSNVPSLTSAENRVLDALLNDERPNPLDLLQVNPEQDLSGFSDISSMSSLSGISALSSPLQLRTQQLSNVKMFNATQEEKNKLAMQLLDEREKNLSTIQKSVERKQGMLKEKVAEADIYAEQQRQSMIQNKIGIQTENYINRAREEIKSNVLNKNMNHKEAQQKLQQLNTFYLKQLDYEQQQRVNKNIFDDIEEIERNRQFRLINRKVGVDSVLSRLRNNESQEKQDRLVNDLIINQNEKKMKDIQSELLGSVSSRAIQKGIEQENILGNLQLGVMDRASGLAEQQSIFNQQSQPQLGLTRTQSGEKIKQSKDTEYPLGSNEPLDLQRTLSAPTVQALDIGRAERKLKEQQESEAIFNRKQQELASEIQDIQRTDSLLERMEADAKRSLSEMSVEEFALPKEPPLMAFGEEDNITARPIEKKESPREKSITEKWRILNNDETPSYIDREIKFINRGDRKIKVDALTGERLPLNSDVRIESGGRSPDDMFKSQSKIRENQIFKIKNQREIWDDLTEKQRDIQDDNVISSSKRIYRLREEAKEKAEKQNNYDKIEELNKLQEEQRQFFDRLDIEYE